MGDNIIITHFCENVEKIAYDFWIEIWYGKILRFESLEFWEFGLKIAIGFY